MRTLCQSALVVVGAALLLVPGPAAAEKDEGPKCRRRQRPVLAGTPVLSGPGLGFDIALVVEKDGCFRRLKTSEDGSFAMILLKDQGQVGWVATGLVDERLSAAREDVEPAPLEGKVRVVRPLVLRRAPRFDSLAVATPLAKDVELSIAGISPDGQWLLLDAPEEEAAPIGEAPDEGAGLRGWAPKYKVAEKLPEEGAAPSAGSGGWAETRSGRRPYAETPAARAAGDALVDEEAEEGAEKGEEAKRAQAPGDEEGESKAVAEGEPISEEAGPEKAGVDEVAVAPVLGRTQEATFWVGYRYWQQNYISDAADDPYYKYDWISPAFLELGGAYSWRGDFPLTIDVSGSLALGGWMHPAVQEGETPGSYLPDPGGEPTPVVSTQLHLSPRVGWRLFKTANVDVDAGGAFTFDALLNNNFSALDPTPLTLVTGMYGGVGPSLVARSRLGDDGRFGLIIVEAQVPVGLYSMVPDPGAIYTNDLPPERQDIVYPPAAGQTDPTVEPEKAGPALPVHLSVGADGRFRYQYAFTHLWRVEARAGVKLRQASIAGPGYRTGTYGQATTIDVMATVGLGMTFGF